MRREVKEYVLEQVFYILFLIFKLYMPHLRNPFPIVKEFTDLRKYESQLNQVIEQFFNQFFKKFDILSLNKVTKTFWALVNETKLYNPLDWYDIFAIFILKIFTTQILLDEGRILRESHDIFIEWFLYLATRIIRNEQHFSSNFLAKLYTDEIIPIPDFEAARTLLQENVDLIKNYEYPNILYDDKLPIVERLRIFRVFYIGFYELFKRKCVYIENQLYRCEGRSHALNTIRDIFQLYNNNDRTPPEYPKKALKVLIHIRNSCTHRNMTILDDGNIRIRDYNNRNNLSYEDYRTITQLNEYYHALLVLDKAFEALALAIILKRRIENLYSKYGKFIQCPDCDAIEFYCILPTFPLIICKNCKFPISLN